MTNLQWYQFAYNQGWCSVEQLQFAVELGQITAAQYQTICGQAYPTSTNAAG